MEHLLPGKFMNSSTGMVEGFANWAYQVTDGIFFTFMLLGFCIILFIATSRYSTARALGFAGVTGLFGSIFLVILGLMSWWVASIFIIFGAISITFMIMSRY